MCVCVPLWPSYAATACAEIPAPPIHAQPGVPDNRSALEQLHGTGGRVGTFSAPSWCNALRCEPGHRSVGSLERHSCSGEAAVRKVRTPQGTVLPNGKASRLRLGRRHVQQRAVPPFRPRSEGEGVKGCGKSAPALLVTGAAMQTPRGERPSRTGSQESREQAARQAPVQVGRLRRSATGAPDR